MKISLRAARVNANLTQKEVVERIGISKTTLCSYEKGRTAPDIDTAKQLAALYGLTVNDIIFSPKDCA